MSLQMEKPDHVKVFERFLWSKGLRLTAPRRRILEVVFEWGGHFYVDQVVLRLRRRKRDVSKATVYRTLALLSEAGLLNEHDFAQGHKVYEVTLGHAHHDHLVCQTCGSIEEFHNDRIEELQDRVIREHGFRAVSHSLRIFGQCRECPQKGRTGESKEGVGACTTPRMPQ